MKTDLSTVNSSADSGERTVARVRSALDEVARELERWCAAPAELLARRPRPDAWSGSEILEHVMLVNGYLLLTLEKQAARALRRARHVEVTEGESDLARGRLAAGGD